MHVIPQTYLQNERYMLIESDHKLLVNIFKKTIHTAFMHIQCMLLKFQPYDYTLVYMSGKSMGLGDCLSRLMYDKWDHMMNDELMVCKMDTLAYQWHEQIEEATREDAVVV